MNQLFENYKSQLLQVFEKDIFVEFCIFHDTQFKNVDFAYEFISGQMYK